MQIVTTTGFYGTGSSAVTDLFSEFENVCCFGDYEIRLAHDPYGISDLEYYLIENPNRHNSSNAIKKFLQNVKRLHGISSLKGYEQYFDKKFLRYSLEYINHITKFEYYGKWHYDVIERGKIFTLLSRSYNLGCQHLNKILNKKSERGYNLLPKNEKAYATTESEQEFLNYTKQYFSHLFQAANRENKEILFIDQLVPPSNIARYERYFENLTTIVVDRDPRDIYLLEKYQWKGSIVPKYDVKLFCKWFLWTRNQYERMPKGNSLKIQFEDLIYDYEKTINQIIAFAKLDKAMHTKKGKLFQPNISRKNTRLWETYPDCINDIRIIERELGQYCYEYKKKNRKDKKK